MWFDSSLGTVFYEVHESDADAHTDARSTPGEFTIVLVHGGAMDHCTFAAQIDALRPFYRVVCMDLPGHGQSDPVDPKVPFTGRAAQVITELLDELGLNRVVLVGQSIGSTLCQRVAARSPVRVIGSVHLGGAPLYPRFNPLARLFTPFIATGIALCPREPLYTLFAARKALRRHTREYLRASAARAGKPLILRLTLDMLREMTAGMPRRLEHPMLICHGEHESSFLKRRARTWHRAQPGSVLAVIKDAHHIANQDNPSAFNRELLTFLRSIDPHRSP